MIFSARSRTRPASGPYTSTIGRAGLGPRDERLRRRPLLSATMASIGSDASASGAGGEIRRQPRLDVIGDHLGGAVLGVALAARAGEALLLAGMS